MVIEPFTTGCISSNTNAASEDSNRVSHINLPADYGPSSAGIDTTNAELVPLMTSTGRRRGRCLPWSSRV